MLSNIPIMLLKLTYYSQIILKIFLVHGQNISFSTVLNEYYITSTTSSHVIPPGVWYMCSEILFSCHTSLDAPRDIQPYVCACSERRPMSNYNLLTGEEFEA